MYSAILGNKSKGYSAPSLKNYYFDKYLIAHDLFKNPYDIFMKADYSQKIAEASAQIKDMFAEFKKTNEFKDLLTKTEDYKLWLKKEWDKNKSKIIEELHKIMRVELPEEIVTVFVLEQNIGGGQYLGDNNIVWGHTEDWPNYSLVYLLHEYLHSFLPHNDNIHAVIELITDNELRIRLNGTGEYFYINDKLIGHEYLLEKEKLMLPKWKNYLKDNNQNIFDFIKNYSS